jgi:methyl-accepting chemotaxis protein
LGEIIGKPHSIFVDVQYAQSVEYKTFWDNLKLGFPQSGDFLRITKEGQEVWLQASYTPVRNVKGELYKIIKLAQNITEKKLAEIEAYKLSLVANNIDSAVIITDKEGKIEYANAGFTKITGYDLVEVKGRKPGDFLQGRDTDKETIQRMSKKLKQREVCYEEILNYHKDGTPYWISITINPVFDTKGSLDKFVSVQTVITEYKLKSLDYSGKLDAIEKAYGVIEFDVDGYILSANPIFLDLMGYTLEEIKGKHHQIFVFEQEKQSEAYKNFWHRLGKEGAFIIDEFCRITKNGDSIWLKGSYNAILDTQGKPYKVVKFAQDITAQKELERKYVYIKI